MAVALFVALAAGCAGGGATPGQIGAGWDAELLWCSDLDRDMFPERTLVAVSAEQLDAAGCVGRQGRLQLPDGPLGVAVSGTDRNGMRLLEATRERLVVEVAVPHGDCAVTADWRGDMVLAVAHGAGDAPLPGAEFLTASEPC